MPQQFCGSANASGCHEAGHDGTEKPNRFATTIQNATKRDLAAGNDALAPSAAHASSRDPESGQRQSKPGGPDCTRRCAPERNVASNLPSSATHPDAAKRKPTGSNDALTKHGALQPIRMGPDQNDVSNLARRLTRPKATSTKPQAAPGLKWPAARPCSRQQGIGRWRCPLSGRRLSSVTHRKAPAANSPRNNVASHRQCEPQPESKSKPTPRKYGAA